MAVCVLWLLFSGAVGCSVVNDCDISGLYSLFDKEAYIRSLDINSDLSYKHIF